MNNSINYSLFDFLKEKVIKKPSKPKKSKELDQETLDKYNQDLKDYEKNKKTHTHIWNGNDNLSGVYRIEDNEMSDFFRLYDEAIMEGHDLHLLERHNDLEYSCLVIDIDERYELDVNERLHTKEHIQSIIELFNEEIKNVFEIDESNTSVLQAFVFEKADIVRTENEVKDGIHIIYPFLISTQWEFKYIRKNILKNIPPIVKDLPLTVKPHQLVDEAVIHDNAWFLYGSKKKNNKIYNLSYVFDHELECKVMDEENTLEFVEEHEISFSELFSVRDSAKRIITNVKEEILSKIPKSKKIRKKYVKRSRKKKEYDIEEIKQIVDILSPSRAENHNQRIEIGWILHNTDPTSKELLEIWINFAEKSDKPNRRYKCETEWQNMKESGLGLGTLYYFAKSDNEEAYNEIVRTKLRSYIDISIESQSDWDLAKVLHEMFKHEFICSSAKGSGEWYQFNGHRWEMCETNTEIYNLISTKMRQEYCRRMSVLNLESVNDDASEEDREEAKKKNQNLLKVSMKLRSKSNKENIMAEAKRLFYNKEFMKKLDENPYLIGFENGVYDLRTKEFRDGCPEDYVSMSTKIDYIPFDDEDDNWAELEYFLHTIFPDKEMNKYFMTFLSSCLQGVNKEEKFRIWIGTGSNGKSKLEELFVNAFGDYCMKFPITLLTGRRAQAGGTSSEVVKSKGKRFCYFEEPSEGEKINAGRLKEYTGGDKLEGRGMYEKFPIEFKPQFKLSLLCNDIPSVPPTDTGVWRRMEVIEFRSKFTDNPVEENEFKIDRDISEKIQRWKELFMGLLIDVYYKSYTEEGISVPEEVEKHTEEYHRQCDKYSDFMISAIEKSKTSGEFVEITELLNEYKEWHTENNNDNNLPTKRDFKRYLEKQFGKSKIKGDKMFDYKFKSTYQKVSHGNSLSLIGSFN